MIAVALLLAAVAARAEWTPEFARGAEKVRRALAAGRRSEAAAVAAALPVPDSARAEDRCDMLRKRAEFRSEVDDLPGAEADLRAALAARPRDFETLCTLTQFLRERGRYADSLAVAQVLSTVTEGIPARDRAEKWLQRAETLMRLGRFDEAVADVDHALRDKAEDVPSLWLMAQVLLRAGRARESLPFADRMIAAASTPQEKARAYSQRAQVRAVLGDKTGAAKDADAGLAADPGDHVALEARVQRLRDEGRFQEALTWSDRMIEAGRSAQPTRRALLYEQRAVVERLLGRPAQAEADLRLALTVEPDSQPVLRRLSEFLLDDARYAEAAEVATRYLAVAAEAAPATRADGLLLRARIYSSMGRPTEAEADRALARKLAPDSAAALRDSASAALAAGDASRALALEEALLKVVAGGSVSDRAQALLGRGSALLALNKRADAEADFLAAVALEPGSLFGRERLAALALEDGRFEEAERRAEALFTVTGSTVSKARAAALVLRARARSGQGRSQEAVEDLSNALGADPSSRDALAALVDALSRQGMSDEFLKASARLFDAVSAAPVGDEAALKTMEAVISALTRLGRADLARPYADRLVDRASKEAASQRADAACARAAVLEALGRGADALADVDAAVAAAPAAREPRRARARLLSALGRPREALSAADDFVAVSSSAAPTQVVEALLWRADRRAEAGDSAGADADHRAAEAAVPGTHARDAEAGVRWAAALAPRDGAAAARALLSKLRRTPGAPADARAALSAAQAESLWSEGDRVAAKAVMAEALGADAPVACHAPLLRERGKAALAWFDACVARLPDDAELRTDRGVARWTAGRTAEGEADFRAALATSPAFLPAAMSLASALESEGKKTDAAKVLEKSLASPGIDAALAKDARAQLERLTAR
jgi:predicted Zn-dependent protease